MKENAYVSLEVQSVNKESVEHNKRANKLLKLTLVYIQYTYRELSSIFEHEHGHAAGLKEQCFGSRVKFLLLENGFQFSIFMI